MTFFLNLSVRPVGLAAALLALMAVQAQAQTAQEAPQAPPQAAASAPMSKGEAKAIRQFHMLDFDRDGKLSRAEISLVPQLAAAFDAADTNHDNYLTLDEVRAFAIKYRAARDAARAAAQ